MSRKPIQGSIPNEYIEQEGLFKGLINWPGINMALPVKFILKKEVFQDARVWMTGEKVTVLEVPNNQNNGVFIYRKADGNLGDHDMDDVKRIYVLGVDEKVAG